MNRKFYPSLLILCLILLNLSSAAAQQLFGGKNSTSKTTESGIVVIVGGGVSAAKSSICGSPSCNDFGPSVSVGGLYKMTPRIGLSGQIEYARLSATEESPQRPLNISFQSEVIGVTGTAVLNLLDSYAGGFGYRSLRKRLIVPYVRVGAGFVYYTPTSYPGQGELHDSQTTYDPARKYPGIALVIPVGGGLRFRLNDEFSIATEMMYHITTTDYLDNIGPELHPAATKDHYGIAAVKLLYTPPIENKIFSRKYSRK